MDKPQLHVESKFLYRIQYNPSSCYYSEPDYPLRIFILQFFNNYLISISLLMLNFPSDIFQITGQHFVHIFYLSRVCYLIQLILMSSELTTKKTICGRYPPL